MQSRCEQWLTRAATESTTIRDQSPAPPPGPAADETVTGSEQTQVIPPNNT
ncbi:hypothetical protein ACQPZJ_39830 [Actinoplanes sp. CA-054009]